MKRQPATPDPLAELHAEMDALVLLHERTYHPGSYCLENERGQCLDAHGGVPNRWDYWQAKESA